MGQRRFPAKGGLGAGANPFESAGTQRPPNYAAILLLVFANLVMTISQVNTASVYSFIAETYDQSETSRA